ncbi:hypothetical protein [uncultured Prevotella sp.]|uniref:hypothetical protein n=1 Tax=uncultured Prevotella sp. TaxID=159272 RepID=UPI0025E634DD|nr:hypothetical protein [uncultured Prevotella sp.]
MNQNEEVPESLGGLGDMLPADVLKKLDELLELLHQKNHISQGSIVFNIYGKGSQHIDNQINIGKTHPDPPCLGREKSAGDLPNELTTDKAMALWKKAQEAGYVDENFQPLISRTQAALLADTMADRLSIKEKWKVFEGLWNRKNMYRDYYKALNLQQSLTFQDEIKKLFR